MKSPAIIVGMLAAALTAAGCAPTGAAAPVSQAVVDEQFNALWDAATEVLTRYRFTIDRADRRAGVITTLPMVGRYWFEFWRPDAATQRDVIEGTLQAIYRQVTINIRPKGSPSPGEQREYLLVAQVQTSRSDLPNPQVTSASEAYDLFLKPPAARRDGMLTGIVTLDVEPTPTGRDKRLEEILAREISSLAAKKLTIFPR